MDTESPMDCEHASTTTLLWCFGEAPEAHALHVSACETCLRVVEEQEVVLGLVRPVLTTLAPSRRFRYASWVALAAALVLTASWALWPPRGVEEAPVETAVATPDDFVDARLDAIEVELDVLTSDPSLL